MTTVLAVAALAGCGSSVSSASSNGGNAVSAADLATLQQEITDAQKQPTFTAPGPAFDVSGLAGKKILSMPVSSQVKTCDVISRNVVDIAKSVGMTGSTYFQNNGGPQAWQQGRTSRSTSTTTVWRWSAASTLPRWLRRCRPRRRRASR
nr:hypothetical protein [Lapillicoccus sp.]